MRPSTLLDDSSSASVCWATWSSMVHAKDRMGDAVPVLVGPACVADQVARERYPCVVARHAVERWELAVIVPALWARHLCTPAVVA